MSKINHIRIFTPMVEQIGNIIRINEGLINAQMEEVNKIKKIKQFIVCAHCRNYYAASFVKKYTPIKCHFCNERHFEKTPYEKELGNFGKLMGEKFKLGDQPGVTSVEVGIYGDPLGAIKMANEIPEHNHE